jgi:hypothetical protein
VEGTAGGGDNHSVRSKATSCPRSHSSRSHSQILAGLDPVPNFVWRPLPLLGDSLMDLEEITCENCGGEHD